MKMAEPGDLIQIKRCLYSHWALFVGNGFIIHLHGHAKDAICGLCANFGSSDVVIATVKKEKLNKVANGDKWLVFNRLDHEYKAKSKDVILKEAEQRVGQKLTYNLLYKNCKHFVTDLRYGKPESRQIQDAFHTASSGSCLIF